MNDRQSIMKTAFDQKMKPRERDKKRRERGDLSVALRMDPRSFPAGEVRDFEIPDFVIPDARLGIEISDVLPAGRAELVSFERSVVRLAHDQYSGPPVEVQVHFPLERMRRSKITVARDLAAAVRRSWRPNIEVCLDNRDLPADFAFVSIRSGSDRWEALGSGPIPVLERGNLAEAISKKNPRVGEYREQLARLSAGWQLWLLLILDARVMKRFDVPREIETWEFSYDFDKVLLSSWEHDRVFDLRRRT